MARYRLYGVTVQADIEIRAPRASRDLPVDLVVSSGPPKPVPNVCPQGTVLASAPAGGVTYYLTRTADGFVMRYPELCDVRIDPDLSSVQLFPVSEDARPLTHVLCSGSVLAAILTLRSHCVLHASAVENAGRAIAYVGRPGSGKSTLAALTCGEGARLLTDDVLRLAPQPGGFACHSGTQEIRLRPAATQLAATLPGTSRPSPDGRTAVALDDAAREVALGALVFPRPSRAISDLQIRRLTREEALLELARYPRTLGWVDRDVIAGLFRWNAQVVRAVPAYEAVIPWGPPFGPGVATTLISLTHSDPVPAR